LKQIEFIDLKLINAQYAEELKFAAEKVIDSGSYLSGECVLQFENKLATYIGVKHAVGVGNGYDALRLILRAYIELGIMHEGDEIIVPANTFIASILAITDNRLKPILVEPDLDTYNLDLSRVEKHISNRTKGIMVVHLYGRVCWSRKLESLAKNYGLKIIEDNAQGIGAMWNGYKTGALGDAAGFSFYPAKNLGALGDGGAITTNDGKLAEVIRALGNYGSKRKYVFEFKGLNSRLDELQAGFLNIKLKYLDRENSKRQIIANYYLNNINNQNIVLPKHPIKKGEHVWHLFIIRSIKREKLQEYLEENNISTLIHYPIPAHKQLAYQELKTVDLPITNIIHNECLSLPVYPCLPLNEVIEICNMVNHFNIE